MYKCIVFTANIMKIKTCYKNINIYREKKRKFSCKVIGVTAVL